MDKKPLPVYEHYRASSLGLALDSSLRKLVQEDVLSGEEADLTMFEFDKVRTLTFYLGG